MTDCDKNLFLFPEKICLVADVFPELEVHTVLQSPICLMLFTDEGKYFTEASLWNTCTDLIMYIRLGD